MFTFFGMAPAYVIITSFYIIGVLLMLGDTAPLRRRIALAMTPEEAAGKSPWRDLKEGVAHTWNTPVLLALVSIAFLMNLVAFPLTNGLMPYVAKNIYALDQTGLGFLVASFAGGALIGSIVLSNVSSGLRLTRLMIVASICLVRDAARLRAHARAALRRAVPHDRRHHAKLLPWCRCRSCCCAKPESVSAAA